MLPATSRSRQMKALGGGTVSLPRRCQSSSRQPCPLPTLSGQCCGAPLTGGGGGGRILHQRETSARLLRHFVPKKKRCSVPSVSGRAVRASPHFVGGSRTRIPRGGSWGVPGGRPGRSLQVAGRGVGQAGFPEGCPEYSSGGRGISADGVPQTWVTEAGRLPGCSQRMSHGGSII